MKYVSKLTGGALALATVGLTQAHAAISFGGDKVSGDIAGGDKTATADSTVQKLVSNALGFLAIVGVLYGIYGGFLIMTAGGAEDKVKTGRQILINVAIGLVVIFLTNSIVQFVLTKILA